MKTNNITYRRVGNYTIPNLVLPPKEASVTLGKWGMLYKDYMLHHKKVLFTTLLTQGKLYQHCAEVEKQTQQNLPVWELINDNFDIIVSKIGILPRVLTYNDFYYTNLIVAKDKSAAFMFDYNLLGKGYVYSDVRNVCYSLGEDAIKAFLEAYGEFDENEIIVDDVAAVLITLYHACQRKNVPDWANAVLNELKTDYENKVQILLNS